MRRIAPLVLLLSLSANAADEPEGSLVGKPAPTFSATTAAGGTWRSEDHFRKGITVVAFLPADGKAHEDLAVKPDPPGEWLVLPPGLLRVFRVALGELPPEAASDAGLLLDPRRAIAKAFGDPPADVLTAFVVGPDGTVAARMSDADPAAARKALWKAIRGLVEEFPRARARKIAAALEERAADLALDPPAKVTFEFGAVVLSWRTREFLVYHQQKTGDWGWEARRQTGPEHDGFRLSARVGWDGLAEQYEGWLPLRWPPEAKYGIRREPYWFTAAMKATLPGDALVLRASLDFGSGADREILERAVAALAAAAGVEVPKEAREGE